MDTLKYYKYDLEDQKIIDSGFYSEKNVTQAYNDLSDIFLDIGYHYAEESGRISEVEKSTRKAELDLQEVCLRAPWLPQVVKKLSLTDALQFTDMFDITEKFCKGIDARFPTSSIKEYRCVTFDITREDCREKKTGRYTAKKYKKVIGFAKAFKEDNKTWSDSYAESYAREQLTKSFEKHGFVRVQKSMFVSKKKMTDKEMIEIYKEICKENPRLYQYMKEMHFSIRGQNLDRDMLNIVQSFSPSKEVQQKLQTIRDDLFLTMTVEKNRVYCYAYNEKDNKYYKYKLTSTPYALGEQSLSSLNSLSVDIMKGNYSFRSKDSFQEVTVEEYDKATQKTNDAFKKLVDEDKDFDFSLNLENISKLVLTLQEPIKEEIKAKSEKEKAMQNYAEKEFKLTFIETPKIEDYHIRGNEREKFFDALAEASNHEVYDETNKYLGTHKEVVQQYVNIPVKNNVVVPHDCNWLRFNSRFANVPTQLWMDAYNHEEKLNHRPDGLATSVVKLNIPEGIDAKQAEHLFRKFSQTMFSENGHPAQYFLQCDKDNPLKLRGTIIVANRRMIKDKWVEKKGFKLNVKGKEETFTPLYGVYSKEAKNRLRDCWLECLEDSMNEKNRSNVKFIYPKRSEDFINYVDKLKSELGKKFDKRRVSVKEAIRLSWKEKMAKKDIPFKGVNLEENTR